jgi:hypothetical protein
MSNTRAGQFLENYLGEDAAVREPGEIYQSDKHDVGFNYHFARSRDGKRTLGPFASKLDAKFGLDHEDHVTHNSEYVSDSGHSLGNYKFNKASNNSDSREKYRRENRSH